MSLSKVLYTPTANSACEGNLFGGVVWRCNLVDREDHVRKIPYMKLTKIASRAVFYYHQAVFRRELKFNLRWVVLDFTDRSVTRRSTQTHLLCHSAWLYLFHFFTDFPTSEQLKSDNLRKLLTNMITILECIYQTGTLFLVRTSPRSDRSTALNLLVQAANFVLANTSKITEFDAGILDSMIEEVRPKHLGTQIPYVTGRAFYHVIVGQTTYYYHTYQYCPHAVNDGCPDCRIAHTQHMAHLKRFLINTHTHVS